MKVEIPDHSSLIQIWPSLQGFVDKALEHTHGTHLHTDILAGVLSGQFVFWTVRGETQYHAIIVTQILQYPRLRALNVFLVGGDVLMNWFCEVQEAIETYAQRNSCFRVQALGRRGWLKLNGYQEVGSSMIKDL